LRFLPEGVDRADVAGEDIGVEGAPFIEHRVQGRLPDVGWLVWEHRDNVSGRPCEIEVISSRPGSVSFAAGASDGNAFAP
jgi:hypothetical protein